MHQSKTKPGVCGRTRRRPPKTTISPAPRAALVRALGPRCDFGCVAAVMEKGSLPSSAAASARSA